MDNIIPISYVIEVVKGLMSNYSLVNDKKSNKILSTQNLFFYNLLLFYKDKLPIWHTQ